MNSKFINTMGCALLCYFEQCIPGPDHKKEQDILAAEYESLKRGVLIDRKVLSTLVSFAEIRRDQWAGVAEMEDPFDIIDELFEASCEEAGSMRDLADSAIKSAYRAIKEANQ